MQEILNLSWEKWIKNAQLLFDYKLMIADEVLK